MYESIAKELELFEKEYSLQLDSEKAFLQPLFYYIKQQRGKWLRPALFFLSQGLVDSPRPTTVQIAVLIELLHLATLLHDDVVDHSLVRRGKKTLNAVWNERISVLMGDYLLARVLSLGVEARRPEILEIISRVVVEMGEGELWEVLEGKNIDIPVEEYLRAIYQKTAVFFGAVCELGGLVISASFSEKERLRQFGEAFGMAFQIRDDILDFSGSAEFMGKPVGQDIDNGKITLPLIFALEKISPKGKKDISQRLKRKTEKDRRWIEEFVKERNGIRKSQEKAVVFTEKSIEILKTFPHSIYRESMEKLVTEDLERTK